MVVDPAIRSVPRFVQRAGLDVQQAEIAVSIQEELKSYSDVRKHVSPAAFTAAMGYISWHNRLSMTAMLETWQAMVVCLAFDTKPIDGLLFSGVKTFLDSHLEDNPQTLVDCRHLADDLVSRLFPKN